MLRWYIITSPSKEGLRSVLKSLRTQHLMVRRRNGDLVACVSNNHQIWLSRVCQDFHANLQVLEEPPVGIRAPKKEVYTAPCGAELYDPILYSHHCRSCLECKKIAGAKVVAKVEPGVEHNLDGVIASLEVVREQLMEKCEAVDELVVNLKAYRDAKGQLSGLYTEVDMRVNAVKLLISEGKLSKE